MLQIAFVLVAALSMVSAGTGVQYVETDTFNNDIDLWQNCDTYTDCFNCTLSKCDWKAKAKGATPTCNNFPNKTSPNDVITIPQLLLQSHQCGDPEALCGFDHNKTSNKVELYFNNKTGAYVPPNYFCTYNLQDHGDSFERYIMKVHQLEVQNENKTEYESNVFVFSKHFHGHGKGEKPTFTYDQFPDEHIHDQIEDGPIPGSFLIEHSSKATVGWINIKGRDSKTASEFRVTIKQISKADLNDEYWHQNEVWIIVVMSIVVISLGVLIWYHFIHNKKANADAAGAASSAGAANAGQGDDQQALLQNQ